ncbi:MAG: prolipoprotein diacylglyceryl transferase family protein [Flavobacteriales bacterium]
MKNINRLVLWVFTGAILGARLGYYFFYEAIYYLKHHLRIFLFFKIKKAEMFRFIGFQGLASHGGVIGILIYVLLYA